MANGKYTYLWIQEKANNLRNIFKGILIGVLFVSTIILSIIIIQQKRQYSSLQYVQENEIVPFLKDGDIILRLSDRPWSMLFKNLSPNDKKFSHLGIVKIRNNIISVIHSEGLIIERKGYVKEELLKDFLKTAQSIGIYRLRIIKGEKISDTALEYKGHPFDWQFDMNEDNNIYCTELLYVILKKLDPEIKLNKIWLKEIGKYIIPVDIYSQSEYFIEILYKRAI
jgi:hypothetical protein